jgi:hypothetical protein
LNRKSCIRKHVDQLCSHVIYLHIAELINLSLEL